MPKVDQHGRPVERRETESSEDVRLPISLLVLLQLVGLALVIVGLVLIASGAVFSGSTPKEQVSELLRLGGIVAGAGVVALFIARRRPRRGRAPDTGQETWRDVVDEATSRTLGQLLVDVVFWSTVAALVALAAYTFLGLASRLG